jgi:aryl-alcohol dehydrogenase-like predicted oxidoreductase
VIARYRTINGHQVNPVGLGCMSLSWAYGIAPSDDDGARLLLKALDLGYDHFDTANIYGLGHNESLIGKTLKSRRKEIFLATKTGIIVDGPRRGIDCSPQNIRTSIDMSLARLQTDHIDLYYLHRFDPKVPIADSIGSLADLITVGKIGSIGLSEWSGQHIREAAAVHPIAAVQTEYSLWTRNPEIAVLDACRDLGISFVAFSPLGRGALANGVRDVKTLPDSDLRQKMPRFIGENWHHNLQLIDQFNQLADDNGVTPAQLSLAWLLARAPNITVIPGTSQIAHLEENIARWDWTMPVALTKELDRLINQTNVAGPRYNAAIQATIDTEEFA